MESTVCARQTTHTQQSAKICVAEQNRSTHSGEQWRVMFAPNKHMYIHARENGDHFLPSIRVGACALCWCSVTRMNRDVVSAVDHRRYQRTQTCSEQSIQVGACALCWCSVTRMNRDVVSAVWLTIAGTSALRQIDGQSIQVGACALHCCSVTHMNRDVFFVVYGPAHSYRRVHLCTPSVLLRLFAN
jgi:hypothetical protein